MNIQISTRVNSLCLAVKSFVVNMSKDMMYDNVDIRFANEADSINAFTQLTSMGVKCYRTGKNAPHGASVLIYSCDKNNFKVKIKD